MTGGVLQAIWMAQHQRDLFEAAETTPYRPATMKASNASASRLSMASG